MTYPKVRMQSGQFLQCWIGLLKFKPDKIIGHVEAHNVDFAYPARPDVFKGFSIIIGAGKSTALVGPSGSGKSTIIGLIERFYDPFRGIVKIDGLDIRSYNLRSLRKHIGLVSQEPTLFSGTVRQNITDGTSDNVDETELIEAAKAANAHNFIVGLENGYDTWCGDRGLHLSGGQKQRIAIARAILKNPSVVGVNAIEYPSNVDHFIRLKEICNLV
ncbi:hypothetical protein RJ640_029859 [Escallonia rubra]|uniref:ABC transporter domain-containing protein n=1 Tax=Escallonia rubra TaxID=112253 RepID=A0AA88QRG0_9ASTE|nr:hypothetical protein RJ640_029859 [Escallonia rubra]